MTTKDGSFEAHGKTWQWRWIDAGSRERLIVSTEDALDFVDGIDQTDWPTDEEISAHVGETVRFFDGGDNNTEALFDRVAVR